MSEIEFITDVKQSPDSAELIIVKQKMTFSGDARPVGAPVEVRLGLLTRKARLTPFMSADAYSGLAFGVKVRNTGAVPFLVDKVAFFHRFDEPQEPPAGAKVIGKHIGGSVDLVPRPADKYEDLKPGEEREYFLPGRMLDGVALKVAGLLPRQYWVAAFSGGEEVGRAPGEQLGQFMAPAQIRVHRRARPAFDSLSEGERVEVIRAVAPLRGLKTERWASQNARPLDGAPNVYSVHATGDLWLLVELVEGDVVEIGDIVRGKALEQFGKPGPAEGGKG